MQSIISNDINCCYNCGSSNWIQIHHIFGASNRNKSTKDGLVIPLCQHCHLDQKDGIHFNKEFRLSIQKLAEKIWIDYYDKTIEDFIERYGRNYL